MKNTITFLTFVLLSFSAFADNSDKTWYHIYLKGNNDIKINLDYVVEIYTPVGDVANPLWVNIKYPNINYTDHVRVVLLSFCDSRSNQVSYHTQLDLKYELDGRFTGEAPNEFVIVNRHISAESICRQEIAVSINDVWQEDFNGSHNFQFNFYNSMTK